MYLNLTENKTIPPTRGGGYWSFIEHSTAAVERTQRRGAGRDPYVRKASVQDHGTPPSTVRGGGARGWAEAAMLLTKKCSDMDEHEEFWFSLSATSEGG